MLVFTTFIQKARVTHTHTHTHTHIHTQCIQTHEYTCMCTQLYAGMQHPPHPHILIFHEYIFIYMHVHTHTHMHTHTHTHTHIHTLLLSCVHVHYTCLFMVDFVKKKNENDKSASRREQVAFQFWLKTKRVKCHSQDPTLKKLVNLSNYIYTYSNLAWQLYYTW